MTNDMFHRLDTLYNMIETISETVEKSTNFEQKIATMKTFHKSVQNDLEVLENKLRELD